MTGQSIVTATIATYAGGSVTATFNEQGGGSPAITQTSGPIDANGNFSLTAWDNSNAIYKPSTTTFIIVAIDGTTFSTTLSVTGTSVSISSAFANAPAPSGGVSQIVAGTNVTIDPTSGVGEVTVNSGGGGAVTFDQIGSGTNLSHGLVVGNGSVLTTASGGFINANEVNGVVIPASAAVIATNASSQFVAASVTGTGTTVVLAASPSLSGIPVAPTASAGTNTTQLATTAFVVGQAGTANPLIDGTAAPGVSLLYARQDHVHPTDTTRAPLASPALTGTPTAPTATAGTNTTQLATTAFVQTATANTLGGSLSNGNASVGAGAGTGGTATLTGLDGTHQLAIATGTLPTLSAAIASVTFTASRGHISYAVLTPANAATALLSGASMIFMSANSATGYTITGGTTPLTASTTYAWNVVAL